MKNILFIVLSFLFLVSCGVQKRKYQKGFYVSSSKLKIQKDKPVVIKKNTKTENSETGSLIVINEESKEEASANTAFTFANLKPKPVLLLSNDEPCDVITLQNGEEVSAKVLEVTTTEIKYRKCNSNDGPLYIVKKTDVFMIKYANGTKEVYKINSTAPDPGPVQNQNHNQTQNQNQNTQNNNQNQNNYYGPKKIQPLAIFALILALLGLFTYGLTCILALLVANIALRKIRQQPDVYSGELLVKIAKIIAYLILAIIIFATLFAFFSI